MKHVGLAVALACLFSGFTWVSAQESEPATYVPRSERDSDSVFTFKGSGKGLVIIDHQTGEITRYTTKRQQSLHRMSPEAEASARAAWESRQESAAEAEAQMREEEEAAAAAVAEENTDDAAESGGNGAEGSEGAPEEEE